MTMPYSQGQDNEPRILNLADDAVIAHPIAPQTGQFAFEWFTEMDSLCVQT